MSLNTESVTYFADYYPFGSVMQEGNAAERGKYGYQTSRPQEILQRRMVIDPTKSATFYMINTFLYVKCNVRIIQKEED